MDKLLEVSEISAGYRGKGVVRGVSLSVQAGEIVCVIGESGCGKSTLLRSVLRLPGGPEISSGSIMYHGRDLTAMRQRELGGLRGGGIGMIYQEPGASLNPIRSVEVQFWEAMHAHGEKNRASAMTRAKALLEKMELKDTDRILKSCPVQLSGGMNQRVAIALAMSLSPDLLLADEPTSALDVTVQAQIVEELLHLRDEFGTGMLIVTHNMGVVARIADRVAVMYAGRIVERGGAKQVLKSPAHPYTRALLAAVPRLDGTLPMGTAQPAAETVSEEGCAFAPRCRIARSECRTGEPEMRLVEEGHSVMCAVEEKA